MPTPLFGLLCSFRKFYTVDIHYLEYPKPPTFTISNNFFGYFSIPSSFPDNSDWYVKPCYLEPCYPKLC